VAGHSPFEIEIATAKFRRCKSPGSAQISADVIQARGITLSSEIHKLILFRVRKNCMSSDRSLLLYAFTRRAIKLTAIINVAYHYYQLHTKYSV
jgi:hypothetical protein